MDILNRINTSNIGKSRPAPRLKPKSLKTLRDELQRIRHSISPEWRAIIALLEQWLFADGSATTCVEAIESLIQNRTEPSGGVPTQGSDLNEGEAYFGASTTWAVVRDSAHPAVQSGILFAAPFTLLWALAAKCARKPHVVGCPSQDYDQIVYDGPQES